MMNRWRIRAVVAATAIICSSVISGASPASAATLNVCKRGCSYTQIAPAVEAATSGDTIRIGPGTYAGGVTIDVNLQIVGAGPNQTIISGGGVDGDGLTTSVLTIGEVNALSEPTVSIRGVTITGGVAQTSPGSVAFFGLDGMWAAGGGIEVPPDASFVGATVAISDSVITGNSVDPTTSIDSGIPCPGFDGQCPFATAFGGGIDTWGSLILDNSTVSQNTVGSAGTASDADGAGICSSFGSLTLINSVVSRNHAVATAPNGRFAEGGGINLGCLFGSGSGESLSVRNSVINDNRADLTTNLPILSPGCGTTSNCVIPDGTNSAGIDLEDAIPATITNSLLTNNSATANDPVGEPQGFNAAISAGGPLNMANSVVSGNQSITYAATSADVGPQGGIIGAGDGGTITNTVITNNVANMFSPGIAAVIGALEDFGLTSSLTVQNSTISGNTAKAISTSSTGVADVFGVGISNGGPIVLIGDHVNDNLGMAIGPSGTAQGGGVWSSSEVYSPVPPQLTLENTTVTQNALIGSHGITVQGGGLFTDPSESVALTHSLIALNIPDQCFGSC